MIFDRLSSGKKKKVFFKIPFWILDLKIYRFTSGLFPPLCFLPLLVYTPPHTHTLTHTSHRKKKPTENQRIPNYLSFLFLLHGQNASYLNRCRETPSFFLPNGASLLTNDPKPICQTSLFPLKVDRHIRVRQTMELLTWMLIGSVPWQTLNLRDMPISQGLIEAEHLHFSTSDNSIFPFQLLTTSSSASAIFNSKNIFQKLSYLIFFV